MHKIIEKFVRFLRGLYIIYSLIIHLFTFRRQKLVIQYESKYNKFVIISQCGSKRQMHFKSLSSGCQSEIDLNRIDNPCVDYIQLMIISLIYYPFLLNDKHFLIFGLGGGILPRAIRKLYPMSLISIIEIDPIVNEMAKKYFYFKEDFQMKSFINDGRNFLNQISNQIFYDIIYLDAYDSKSGLPSHMKTQEFFLQLKNCLNQNGGLIIINLVCIYKSYFNIRQTITSVFQENNLITFRSNDFLNIILVASVNIQEFPIINEKSSIIYQMKEKLSIDVYSLIKRRQKQLSKQNLSTTIYRDNIESIENQQPMSLIQFINVV